ncbi:MAG: protein-L-isoaspartate(D-aspartate) O-methyltransferase [Planctomycetota bacterium]
MGCKPQLQNDGASPPLSNARDQHARVRNQMVQDFLIPEGIDDARVLDAMRRVPRHRFVPPELESHAYEDRPLPIGHEQTISQPFIVAYMTQHLNVAPGDKVLEVGTGSGYQAAVLAELGAKVFSIEIVRPLGEQAAARLKELAYEVSTRIGDGYQGWPEEAPFDAIIVTAAPDHVPPALKAQLKRDGGRMIVPVGERYQALMRITRHGDDYETETLLPVRFVPMTGQAQER